jgi:hypothetical protein
MSNIHKNKCFYYAKTPFGFTLSFKQYILLEAKIIASVNEITNSVHVSFKDARRR